MLEQRIVAQRALGKPLPASVIVHHVNENRADNRPENLVICPNDAYHQLLHRRMRALDGCGRADWIKCPYCKQWDEVSNLYMRKGRNGQGFHRSCAAAYKRKQR
jgi:hypothetical protein